MAASKSQKIQAEIDKVKAKISEQQARLKELEKNKQEAENSEIVDIVRGMSISLEELPLVLQRLRDGGTSGQSVQKSAHGAPAKSDDFVGRGGATERADFGGGAAKGAKAKFATTTTRRKLEYETLSSDGGGAVRRRFALRL